MARKKKTGIPPFIPTGGFLKDRPTPRLTEKSHWLKQLEEQQRSRMIKLLKREGNVQPIRKIS